MKKLMLFLAMIVLIAFASVNTVSAQEVDSSSAEDSLSIDDMAPVFYEDTEEASSGSSSTTTIVIIVIAVAVVGGAAYYFTKKKK